MLKAGLRAASDFMGTNAGAAVKAGLAGAGVGFGLAMGTGHGLGMSTRMAAFGGLGASVGGVAGHMYGARGISGNTFDVSKPFSRLPAYFGAGMGNALGMGFAKLSSNQPVNSNKKRK